MPAPYTIIYWALRMTEKTNKLTVTWGAFQPTKSKLQRKLEDKTGQDQGVVKRWGHILKKTKPGQDLALWEGSGERGFHGYSNENLTELGKGVSGHRGPWIPRGKTMWSVRRGLIMGQPLFWELYLAKLSWRLNETVPQSTHPRTWYLLIDRWMPVPSVIIPAAGVIAVVITCHSPNKLPHSPIIYHCPLFFWRVSCLRDSSQGSSECTANQ